MGYPSNVKEAKMENGTEPRLPQSETVYSVAGIFGADNEPQDHWETVGAPRHRIEDAETERDAWQRDFPGRKFTILKATTTWERIG